MAKVKDILFTILSLIKGGLLLARVTKDQSRMEQILSVADRMIQGNMISLKKNDLKELN